MRLLATVKKFSAVFYVFVHVFALEISLWSKQCSTNFR